MVNLDGGVCVLSYEFCTTKYGCSLNMECSLKATAVVAVDFTEISLGQ